MEYFTFVTHRRVQVQSSLLLYGTMIRNIMRNPEIDFEGIKASQGRYSIHSYPAMLHPMLVSYIIEKFGGKVLYDPFCGSGVSLVEGLKRGFKVYGTDINPIALLISDVRCSNFDIFSIDKVLQKIKHAEPDIPEVKNIEYWFKPKVILWLGKIRSAIKDYQNTKFYKLLLVAFSQTVRDCSNNRKGEFKRYRMSENQLKNFNPDPVKVFENRLRQYLNIVLKERLENKNLHLIKANVLEKLPIDGVDLVITSPPYGDSKTTVAYEQFLSFSFEWLKGLNPYGDSNLEPSLGKSKINVEDYPLIIDEVYEQVSKCNQKRAMEVRRFYLDLHVACKNIASVLKDGATVCFVVGNRKVSGLTLPTNQVVEQIFEKLGLVHITTWIRKISNKRMPNLNAPKNRKGEKDNTMQEEYVIVMRK